MYESNVAVRHVPHRSTPRALLYLRCNFYHWNIHTAHYPLLRPHIAPSYLPLLPLAFVNRLHRHSPLSTFLPTHENIYTLPNILTFSRLIAAPIVGYLIIHDLHTPALGLFVYAGVTDLVDGWIARKWGLQTVLGTVIDPMADKALMTVVTVTLAMEGVLPSEWSLLQITIL